MQADRGLVEDVEHAHQPRADLAGQPDPLGLAAGERRRRAVERQVVQADVGQEAEPAADLLEQLLGDRPRERVEWPSRASQAAVERGCPRQGIEEPGDLADRHRAQLDQRLAADLDGPGPGLSRAPWHSGQVMLRMYGSSCARVGPPEAPAIPGQQLGGDSVPLLGVRPDLALALPAVDDHPVAGAVEPGAVATSRRGLAKGP